MIGLGRVPRYATVQAACAASVSSEIENATLYDRVLAHTGRADLTAVDQNLQRASRQNHLPAFERCAEARRAQDGPPRGGCRRGRRVS